MSKVVSGFNATMKDKLSRVEYGYLEQAVQGTPNRIVRLPNLRKLKIANLSLFSKDFDLLLKEGINVVYGGNRNGKTTVANAIEFGIFGVFQHTQNYFASRIENPEKPLRIEVEVGFGNSFATIRREIYELTPYHKPKLTFFGEGLVDSGPSIEGAVEVQRALEERLGCTISEAREVYDAFYLREVPRNYHLSSRIQEELGSDVRKRILYRLIDLDKFNRVMAYCRSRIDELQRDITSANSELEQIRLQSSSQEKGKVNELKDELKTVEAESSKLAEQRSLIFEEINTLMQDSKPAKESREATFELAEVTIAANAKAQGYEKLKAATKLEEHRVICDRCGQEYTQEAYDRISKRKCLTCGHPITEEQLSQIALDIEGLRKREESIKSNVDKIQSSIEESGLQIQELQKRLNQVDSEIQRLTRSKLSLESEIIKGSMTVPEDRINELINEVQNASEKERDWSEVLVKTVEYAEKQTSTIIADLNRHFTSYISDIFQESNGVSFDKSLNLVDRSGKILSFEHLSHGEKNLLEIAYRLALLDVALQNKTLEYGCLILETPEEALDLTYRKGLTNILSAAAQKGLRLIVTTSDRESIVKLKSSISTICDLVKVSTSVSRQQARQLKLTEFRNR